MCPYESRPEESPRAASKAFGGADGIVSKLRVGPAVARIRLDRADDTGRAIQNAANYPPGTRVVLVVAPRQRVVLAVDDLRERGQHLGRITIECSDVTTQLVWIDALRCGVTQWVDPLPSMGGDAA